MFKDMFRRTYVEKIYQNIFVSKRLIPRLFAESTYFYRPLIIDDIIKMKKNGIFHKDLDIKKYKLKKWVVEIHTH